MKFREIRQLGIRIPRLVYTFFFEKLMWMKGLPLGVTSNNKAKVLKKEDPQDDLLLKN